MVFRRATVQGEVEEWGGRRLTIEFDRAKYETPSRLINSTEIKARDRLAIFAGFEVPVIEYTSRLRTTFPERLARANGTFKDNKARLIRFRTNHRGKEVVYRPQLPYGSYFDRRGIKMLMDMQIEAELGIVTIPELPPDKSGDEYLKCIQSAIGYGSRTAGKDDLLFMPYLEMAMDNEKFDERLCELTKMAVDGGNVAIGLRLASYDDFRSNYESVNEYEMRTKDIWVHGSGALDYATRGPPSARQHIPQRFGIDTAALLVKSAPQNQNEVKSDVVNSALGYIRLFNNPTVEILKPIDFPGGALTATRCSCSVCENRTIAEGIQSFAMDEGGPDEGNVRDYVRLHNANMSMKEFGVSQKRAKERDLKGYFKSKKGLKPFSE